jgi:hypothetical protein
MLVRSKTGDIIDVKLADFATDKEYYNFILTLIND